MAQQEKLAKIRRAITHLKVAVCLPANRPFLSMLLTCIVATSLTTGCSESTKRKWKYRSPEENYRNALEAEHADVRRDAVVRIAESKYADSDTAFQVLDAAARTDPQTQIRCIAIRALACYDDDRPISTLLAILKATKGDQRALPANEDVRWEAALALIMLEEKGFLANGDRDTALTIYIQMVEPDQARRVRIAGTAALGAFQNRKVFAPLISTLRDRDFAIADCAERSLIKLTGVTHDYNADVWAKWLTDTDDPFANAGHIPEITRPAGPSWWDKQVRAWRRGLKLSNE